MMARARRVARLPWTTASLVTILSVAALAASPGADRPVPLTAPAVAGGPLAGPHVSGGRGVRGPVAPDRTSPAREIVISSGHAPAKDSRVELAPVAEPLTSSPGMDPAAPADPATAVSLTAAVPGAVAVLALGFALGILWRRRTAPRRIGPTGETISIGPTFPTEPVDVTPAEHQIPTQNPSPGEDPTATGGAESREGAPVPPGALPTEMPAPIPATGEGSTLPDAGTTVEEAPGDQAAVSSSAATPAEEPAEEEAPGTQEHVDTPLDAIGMAVVGNTRTDIVETPEAEDGSEDAPVDPGAVEAPRVDDDGPVGDDADHTPGDKDWEDGTTDDDTDDARAGDEVPEPRPSRFADWRPDPTGRFELRRFFLGQPTSVVRSGDVEVYDPVPTSPDDAPSSSPEDVSGAPAAGEPRGSGSSKEPPTDGDSTQGSAAEEAQPEEAQTDELQSEVLHAPAASTPEASTDHAGHEDRPPASGGPSGQRVETAGEEGANADASTPAPHTAEAPASVRASTAMTQKATDNAYTTPTVEVATTEEIAATDETLKDTARAEGAEIALSSQITDADEGGTRDAAHDADGTSNPRYHRDDTSVQAPAAAGDSPNTGCPPGGAPRRDGASRAVDSSSGNTSSDASASVGSPPSSPGAQGGLIGAAASLWRRRRAQRGRE